jgi:hypothetical protein
MRQVVENYEIKIDTPVQYLRTHGDSASPKSMIFHAIENDINVKVLDIGFGLGNLGELIKVREKTAHWTIDGIDGDISNCFNKELFESYRESSCEKNLFIISNSFSLYKKGICENYL